MNIEKSDCQKAKEIFESVLQTKIESEIKDRFLREIRDTDDSEIVNMVASKVSQAGNRSERRKILKALNKTKNIERYANRELSKKANAEVVEQTNNSFGYIMSMAGILLHDKYGWDDDSVGNFFTEISQMMNGKWSDGKSVEDVAKELYEKTGIELRVE